MKIKILIAFCFLWSFVNAQDYTEYPIENFKKTYLEINAPKDTVMKYMKYFYQESLSAIEENSGKLFFHFPDSQFFALQEDVLEAKKEGRDFHNIYDSYSLIGSDWELILKEVSKDKTQISFEMKKALVNKEYFRAVEGWEKYYKGKEKEFVSNEVLEDLISHYFQLMLATSPLVSIDLEGLVTYQNAYYGYFINLKLQTKFNEKLIQNKEIPKVATPKSENGILIYDRNNSNLYLFDLKAKNLKWERKLPNEDDQNMNAFTQYQNTIYVATGSGYVLAIDANSGEIYWQNRPMGDEKLKGGLTNFFFGQRAPVSDDKVFVNKDGVVYALDRFTGKAIWSQEIGGYGHYNYSFDQDYLYKSGISEMFKIRKSDGKVFNIWNSIAANTFYEDNLLENEMLYFAGYGYDVVKDELVWGSKKVDGDVLNQITTTDFIFLSNQGNAVLNAIDKKSGEQKWSWKPEAKENLSASFLSETDAGNEISVLVKYHNYSLKTDEFALIFIDKKSGKLEFSIEISGQVISNSFFQEGKIYVQTNKGFIEIDRKTKKSNLIPFDFSDKTKAGGNYLNYAESVK